MRWAVAKFGVSVLIWNPVLCYCKLLSYSYCWTIGFVYKDILYIIIYHFPYCYLINLRCVGHHIIWLNINWREIEAKIENSCWWLLILLSIIIHTVTVLISFHVIRNHLKCTLWIIFNGYLLQVIIWCGIIILFAISWPDPLI
jgi:hypothetical protein